MPSRRAFALIRSDQFVICTNKAVGKGSVRLAGTSKNDCGCGTNAVRVSSFRIDRKKTFCGYNAIHISRVGFSDKYGFVGRNGTCVKGASDGVAVSGKYCLCTRRFMNALGVKSASSTRVRSFKSRDGGCGARVAVNSGSVVAMLSRTRLSRTRFVNPGGRCTLMGVGGVRSVKGFSDRKGVRCRIGRVSSSVARSV